MGLLGEQERDRFGKLEFLEMVNSDKTKFWCPGSDCSYYAETRENILYCEKCDRRFCQTCRMPEHPQKTCSEADNQTFISCMRKNSYLQCPNASCAIWIEKSAACSHIKCLCGKEFCFNCLGSYPNCECLPTHLRSNLVDITDPDIVRSLEIQ